MKMTNELLMDYLDGRLDDSRRVAVEAHLQLNADDAALLADIKVSQAMLKEWDAAEPVRASDDFWIKVREQLPEKPGSNPLRALGQSVMAWLWPQNARAGLPARVAAIALCAAMAFALFSPRDATHTAQAEISPADRTFIQQSMNRHQAYLSTQPLADFDTRSGDGRDGDGDGEEGEGNDDYTP